MEGDQESRLREQPVVGVDERSGAIVVKLAGDLDLYNAEQVRSALASAIDRSARVVVDLGDVDFIDSTALGALVDAHQKLDDGLRIANPQDPIRRALQVSGIDRHVKVHDTVDDALAS
jgi:anti-sigma B factor antagonist